MENKKFLLASVEDDGEDESDGRFERIDRLLAKVRSEEFELGETLELLTKQEHEAIWNTLSRAVDLTIEALMEDDLMRTEEESELLVGRLKRITLLASFYFEKTNHRPSGLLDAAEGLHDILIPLDDSFRDAQILKVAIARMCEFCWSNEEASAESTITQLIPFLLLSSLGPNSTDADVKRVFNIRKAILLLDFEDESIESIKSLLLRCYLHSAFLRVKEGRRFLSFFLTVDQGLHAFIVEALKPQLIVGSRTVANSYGEVLLRAWRDAGAADSQVSRESLEELVQGFAHEAIHASDKKYFHALRQLLGVFHSDKKSRDIDPMLLRVYSPIIWRSLQCANAIVRAQAAMIFFDIFPLNDPNSSASEDEALKQRQFDLISALLKVPRETDRFSRA